MPFELMQMATNGRQSMKEELIKLLRGGWIGSVRGAFVVDGLSRSAQMGSVWAGSGRTP